MRVNREALAALRAASGDSYDSLAERTEPKVTAEAIRLIETGVTTAPRTRTLKSLARALRCPLGAITLPERDEVSA